MLNGRRDDGLGSIERDDAGAPRSRRCLGAIGALLSVGGAYPWWSLAIFALCVYVVHGIIVFGEEERA